MYPWGQDDVGGMYMLMRFMSCLCRRTFVDCISNVLSAGMCESVCGVVLVKGMSLCISVINPPPSP